MGIIKLPRAIAATIGLFLCNPVPCIVEYSYGETPATQTSPTVAGDQEVTTRGVFKSDRGDFTYVAHYWPDDGAKEEKIGSLLLKLNNDLEDATTFDQLAAVYSPESLPYLNTQRRVLIGSGGSVSNETPNVRTEKRLTHLIIAVDVDKSDIYFARTEVLKPIHFGGDPTPRTLTSDFLDAFRGRSGVVKFDAPARESPIYEALKFNEWERFGLPSPILPTRGPTTNVTTRPVVKDPATPAETKEMKELVRNLDPTTLQMLDIQLRAMPNLSERQETLWVTEQARRILATRPSTQPIAP